MFQEKLDFMIEEGRRLRNAITALGITYDDLRPLRSGIKYKVSTEGEVTWTEDPKSLKKKDEAGYTFHEAYEYLNGSPSCLDSGVLLEKSDFDGKAHPPDPAYLFKPGFHFNDDPEGFGGEFRHIRWIFAYTKGKDEQVDFLAMRALSHVGKMIGRLEAEGHRRDTAAKSGKTVRKGYVSHQEVVETAKGVGSGISERRKATLVSERLLKKEAEKTNPNKVYSEGKIRKILKENK